MQLSSNYNPLELASSFVFNLGRLINKDMLTRILLKKFLVMFIRIYVENNRKIVTGR